MAIHIYIYDYIWLDVYAYLLHFRYLDLYFGCLDLYLGVWTCIWVSGLVFGYLDLYFRDPPAQIHWCNALKLRDT